jgi:hypothetical protein
MLCLLGEQRGPVDGPAGRPEAAVSLDVAS